MPQAATPARHLPSSISAVRIGAALLAVLLIYRFFDDVVRVLMLLYAAGIVAAVLNTLVRRIPVDRKVVSSVLALLLVVGLVAGLWFGGSLLLDQLRELMQALPEIEAQLQAWMDVIRARTGISLQGVGEQALQLLSGSVIDGGEWLGRARSIAGALVIPLLILAGGLFALANPNDRLLVPLLQTVPPARRPAVRRALELLAGRLVGWIQGQLIAMVAVGTLATIAFYAIGVPYALLLGVVNGLAEFVPLIGPWLGGVPAVIVATVEEPMKGVWTALAMFAIQALENWVVTPLAMARGAKVHPFVTLFALLFFGGLFGVLGVLLAVPLVLLIWTAVQVFWVEETLHADHDKVEPLVQE